MFSLSNSLVCSNYITELFYKFCCLFYLSQSMNINMLCDIWNNWVNNKDALNFIQESQSKVAAENITKHYIFTMPDQVPRSGFLQKRSNYWVSSLSQVLHYSPLPDCLAYLWNHLLQHYIMAKDSLVSMSIVELEKFTITCSMEMNLSTRVI